MAKTTERLTPWKIKALSEPGRHADGGNLYCLVRESGAKSWVFLYRWKGKPTEAGGGSINAVSLKQARAWAAEGRAMLAERPARNPQAVWKQQAGTVPTFAALAADYIEYKSREWRSPAWTKMVTTWLTTACDHLDDKPVSEITTADIVQTLRPLYQSAPTSAGRLRGHIEHILAGAQVLGHIVPDKRNVATWRHHLAKVLPKQRPVQHRPSLGYAEMPAFMTKLRTQRRDRDGRYFVAAYALEFLILTAARPGEVQGARWSEINEKQRLWSIPATRMKANRSHQVPLTDSALAILKVMRELRLGDLVFPGIDEHRPTSRKRLVRLLSRLEVAGTPHGFRSSFRDWAGDATNFPREIAEVALAHAVGDATERSYRRSHPLLKHRQLLEQWEAYLFPRRGRRR
jgi:integrase